MRGIRQDDDSWSFSRRAKGQGGNSTGTHEIRRPDLMGVLQDSNSEKDAHLTTSDEDVIRERRGRNAREDAVFGRKRGAPNRELGELKVSDGRRWPTRGRERDVARQRLIRTETSVGRAGEGDKRFEGNDPEEWLPLADLIALVREEPGPLGLGTSRSRSTTVRDDRPAGLFLVGDSFTSSRDVDDQVDLQHCAE